MSILKLSKSFTAALLISAAAIPAAALADAHKDKEKMAYAKQNVVEVAMGSADHTTLVAAVKAAGLVETLSGTGPFTVFAPTNAAFAALPAGTVDSLLLTENKPVLTKVLTYHVVAGKVKAADLIAAINAGGGKHSFQTVSGGTLTATLHDGKVMITDETGASGHVTAADLKGSNGVIHVVDKVLMPK